MDESGKARLLHEFWSAGHHERVEKLAVELLQDHPENETAHYYLARTCIQANRLKEAKRHRDVILGRSPNKAGNHHAVSSYLRARSKPKEALAAIDQAIALAPREPVFHGSKAQVRLAHDGLPMACSAANRAHELAPRDPHVRRIWIEPSALERPGAADALRRIGQLREALALDPQSAPLRNAIGLIYLDELHDARAAEAEFAESLRLVPQAPAYAHNLFRAIANRSLFYRTLCVPGTYFDAVLNLAAKISDGCLGFIFWILTFKLWIVLLLWIGILALLFWPVKKVFEGLFIADLLATTKAGSHKFRILVRFQRLPFWQRISLFVGFLAGLWALIFFLTNIPLKSGFIALAIFIALNFLFALSSQTLHRLRTQRALRKASAPLARP